MYIKGSDAIMGTAMDPNKYRHEGRKFISGKNMGAPAQAIMRMFSETALNRTANCIPPRAYLIFR